MRLNTEWSPRELMQKHADQLNAIEHPETIQLRDRLFTLMGDTPARHLLGVGTSITKV